jgi:hypothetical protein
VTPPGRNLLHDLRGEVGDRIVAGRVCAVAAPASSTGARLADRTDDDVIRATLAAGAEFSTHRPRCVPETTRVEGVQRWHAARLLTHRTGSPDLASPGNLASGATPT